MSPPSFRPSIGHPFKCSSIEWHFAITCFVRLRVDMGKTPLLLLRNILHEHVLQPYMLRPSDPRLDAMPTHIHCRHGSRESLRISVLSRSVSFTIPSAIPVVQAYKSASAEHDLTDRCVRDHAERVALLQLHFSTACALASHGLPWPVAVCVHVHGLWEHQMASVKHFALGTPFKYRVMRCMLISSLSVGQRIMRAVSFTLYMMSCFLQAVHDVCALLASVQRLSHGCPAHG